MAPARQRNLFTVSLFNVIFPSDVIYGLAFYQNAGRDSANGIAGTGSSPAARNWLDPRVKIHQHLHISRGAIYNSRTGLEGDFPLSLFNNLESAAAGGRA
jgi:hypothetical protein